MVLGCQFTNITCTDDSTNRVEQAPWPVFRLFFGVGGVSLGGKSVDQAPWLVFRLFFVVGGVSLGEKSVEPAAWPVFGLFFEHANIFTS